MKLMPLFLGFLVILYTVIPASLASLAVLFEVCGGYHRGYDQLIGFLLLADLMIDPFVICFKLLYTRLVMKGAVV